MSFTRLTRGDVLAALAALALLFVLAADWYSSVEGEEARRIERLAEPDPDAGAESFDLGRRQQEEASIVAEDEERNAWQADGLIDRVILLTLLGTVAAALGAAALRAAGRRYEPPRTPSGIALALAFTAAALVVYRMAQEPGFDAGTAVRDGPFLALAALGALSLGALMALRAEQDGTAWEAAESQAETASEEERSPEQASAGGDELAEPASAEAVEGSAEPAQEAATGAAGRRSRRRGFTAAQREQIADIARSDPREIGKPFDHWTRARLAAHLEETGVVDSISSRTVGRILRERGVSLG